MANNSTFLWFNRWSESSATITASSTASGFATANTQKQQVGKKWRSSSISSVEWIRADFGSAKTVEGVAVVGANFSNDGKLRVRVSNNADLSSPLYDSGFVFGWQGLFGAGEEPDGADSEIVGAGGVPTTDTKSTITKMTRVILLPSSVSGRYVRVDFDDATNVDGYIEVSYMFAGLTKTLTVDVAPTIRFLRPSSMLIAESSSGQPWLSSLFKTNIIEAEFKGQGDTDTKNFWHLMTSHLGITKEFIVVLRNDKPSWEFWTTLYCRFAETPIITHESYSSHLINAKLQELVHFS